MRFLTKRHALQAVLFVGLWMLLSLFIVEVVGYIGHFISIRHSNTGNVKVVEAPKTVAIQNHKEVLGSSNATIPDSNYAIPAGAKFVATNGNDANAGTQGSPYASLTKAVSVTGSGGTIVLRGGVYREGSMKSDDTGADNSTLKTITKKLTIQAYPHEQVWLDGTVVVSGWVADGGGGFRYDNSPSRFLCKYNASTSPCYQSASQINASYPMAGSPQMVFIDSVPQTEVASRAAATAGGTFFFDTGTNQLYLGSNPNGHTVEVTIQRKALEFSVSSGGSQLLGVGIRRYGSVQNPGSVGGYYANAMVVVSNGSNGTVIENSLFFQSASKGLLVSGTQNDIVRNNVFLENGMNGVDVNASSGLSFTGNRIVSSNSEHFSILSGATAVIAGSKMVGLSGSTISDNTFEDNDGTGWWCDVNCSGVTVVRNISRRNNLHGFYYEISHSGVLASNLAYSNKGYGIKVSSDNTQVYNNTLARNHQAILVYQDNRDNPLVTGVTVKNNIFSNNDGTSAQLFDTLQDSQGGVGQIFSAGALNYNAYHRDSAGTPSNLVKWCAKGSSCSTYYTSFSSFKSGAGVEANGLGLDQANPFFASEGNGDYQQKSGSPAICKGEALPAGIATAIGVGTSPVNLGALKWPGSSAIPGCPAAPASTPSPTPAPTTPPDTSSSAPASSDGSITSSPGALTLSSPIPLSQVTKAEVLVNGKVVAVSTNGTIPNIDTTTLSNGTYEVALRVTGKDGKVHEVVKTVNISNKLSAYQKVRNFLLSPLSGQQGTVLDVIFGSSVIGGLALSIASYYLLWRFHKFPFGISMFPHLRFPHFGRRVG